MNSPSAAQEAERYFHNEIPITRAMGLRVEVCDENQFIVAAPVNLNSNHLRTGFGGSINAVATLAGYGLLWSALRDEKAHVVVAESSIRFLRPVRKTIHAACSRPGPERWVAFQDHLKQKGKASINLKVTVVEEGEHAADFEGKFVTRLE